MEAQWHVSRHFVGFQARRVRWLLSQAPSPPDQRGRSESDSLFVMGGWHQNTENDYLWVANLHATMLGDGRAQVESADVSVQAAWLHKGQVTDLKVMDQSSRDGTVVIVAGSSGGSLSFLRLSAPSGPGSSLSDVEVLGGCTEDGASLVPWLPQLHEGRVASVDLCPATNEVLTAGDDGRIFAFPTNVAGSTPLTPFHDSGGASSFHAARWRKGELGTFVTVGTSGGLACWDMRLGPQAVQHSPKDWSAGPLLSLEVHPSNQHVWATAGAEGELAVWDLRLAKQPMAHKLPEKHRADIWEVKFDMTGSFGREALAPMLLCNEMGSILKVSLDKSGELSCDEILTECCSVNSFDMEPQSGKDLVWVSDQECAGYIRRPPK